MVLVYLSLGLDPLDIFDRSSYVRKIVFAFYCFNARTLPNILMEIVQYQPKGFNVALNFSAIALILHADAKF